MNLSDLKPIKDKDKEFVNFNHTNYVNHICIECKKEKAKLIRGTKEYLCDDCFKKWLKIQNKWEVLEKDALKLKEKEKGDKMKGDKMKGDK